MDAYILAGQSNAQGHGDISQSPLGFKTLDRSSVSFYRAVNGDGINNGNGTPAFSDWAPMQLGTTAPSTNKFGPEFGVVDALLAHAVYTNNFAFIKYAVGGSSLAHHWKPSEGVLAQNLVDVFNDAKSKKPEINLRGIIWFQGESDYADYRLASYANNMRELIAFWRNALNDPQLPVVIIGTHVSDAITANTLMDEAKRSVADRDTKIGYVPVEWFTYVDRVHFDGDALTSIGKMAGKEMLYLAGHTDYGWNAIGTEQTDDNTPVTPANGNTLVDSYTKAMQDCLDVENQVFGEPFTYRGITNKTIASNTKETTAMQMAGYVQGNAITITILPPNSMGMGNARPKVNEKITMRETIFIIRQVQQNEQGHSFTLILEQINEQNT